MRVVANNEYVLVELVEESAATEGGLLVVGSLTGTMRKGRIVHVGPLVPKDADLVAGVVVAFHDGHGEKVEGRDDVRVVPYKEIRYTTY